MLEAPDDPPDSPELISPPTWRDRLELLQSTPSLTPARLVTGGLLAAVAVVMAIAVLRGPPAPVELAIPQAGGPGDPAATSSTATTTPSQVLVHAAGAVRVPGVYSLVAGARVADVVQAAGGPLDDAQLDRLNLAAPVVDGQQVYVPRQGEAVPEVAGATGGAEPTGDTKVNVNTASADQLDTLPGVGPATAAAILDERDRRGTFSSVEDLLDVRGIGEAKLEGLRDLVTL